MSSLFLQKNINIYLRREFFLKKNINNRKNFFSIKSLGLRMIFREVESFGVSRVIEMVSLMELISGGKIYIVVKRSKVYTKGYVVVLNILLRRLAMFNFMLYLSFIYLPIYTRRYGLTTSVRSVKKTFFSIVSIKDKRLFYKYRAYKKSQEYLYISGVGKFLSIEDCNYFLKSLKLQRSSIDE